MKIKIGIYEHFKGSRYEVIGVAKHSETFEEFVVYRALYGKRGLWVRPLKMFLEEVAVGGRKVPRFRAVKNQKRPVFVATVGQVDYTKARWAPVVNCVVKYRDKILAVERSKELNFYPGYWNGISGFLDDRKSLKQKVITELKEEIGIPKSKIERIQLGEIFDQEEPKYGKTWIVHPVLVEVSTDRIKLDWEAKNHRWLSASEVKNLKLLPGFVRVLEKLSLI